MNINIKKIETNEDKELLAGFLMNEQFARAVSPYIKNVAFISNIYLRSLIIWGKEYFDTYEAIPNDLEMNEFILIKAKERNKENDTIYMENIALTLENIRKMYFDKGFNEKFYTTKAKSYLTQQNMLEVLADIKVLTEKGHLVEAETKMVSFNSMKDTAVNDGTFLFDDDDTNIKNMFAEREANLFDVPGAFGEMMGEIHRSDVIGIAAATKRGKSWVSNEFAKWAFMSNTFFRKLNVIKFTLEMDTHLESLRFFKNFAGECEVPIENDKAIPYFDEKTNEIKTKFIKRKGLTLNAALKLKTAMGKQYGKKSLKIIDPSDLESYTLKAITEKIDLYVNRDNWVPDVIIVDYLDILENDLDMPKDPLEAENEKWKRFRRLGQKYNAVMVSPTQFNRGAVKNDGDTSNTGGTYKKTHHMTHYLMLNQAEDEERAGLMRFKCMGREQKRSQYDEVVTTSCLAIGRPIMDSRWKSDIPNLSAYIDGINIGEDFV